MEGSDEDHTETQSQPSFKEQRQGRALLVGQTPPSGAATGK